MNHKLTSFASTIFIMQRTESKNNHQTFDVSGSPAAFSLRFRSHFHHGQHYYLTPVNGVIESKRQLKDTPSSSLEVFVFLEEEQ